MLEESNRMLYRDWLALRTHLLWCYDHDVDLPPEVSDVYHSDWETNSGAWLVRSGWAEARYGEEVYRAEPGQWLIVRPGHRVQSFPVGTHLLSVAFESDWPDGSHFLEQGLPVVFDAAACPVLEKKAKKMARAVARFAPTNWDAKDFPADFQQFFRLEREISDWLLTLVHFLVERGVRPSGRFGIDERVLKAVRLLDAHRLDEWLDPEALARQVGLSLVHLTRLFHRDLQTTPQQYYENRRIEAARRHLATGRETAKLVAVALGFKHLSYFSAWFKKATGYSPRAFVKQFRNHPRDGKEKTLFRT
ncbi:MAG: AraC family transcriptional regulator [Lentisphaeria bacterium]|nr:AraC family transcriptional regulator [Lentisphaeria bacterium]